MENQSLCNLLLSLLRSKNHCIRNLIECGFTFLSLPDSHLIESDQATQTIKSYHLQREQLFKNFSFYEKKINDIIPKIQFTELDEALFSLLKGELTQTEILLQEITQIDDQVIKKIQALQEITSKQLSESRKNRETLNKFKSTWISTPGEEVDQTL